MKRVVLFELFALLFVVGCVENPAGTTVVVDSDTTTPTLTFVASPTATLEPAATSTIPRPTLSPTSIPPTSSPTPTPTETPPPTEPATETPEPTETPTLAPTATQIPAPTSAPTVSAADTAVVLRQKIGDAILELGNYRRLLDERSNIFYHRSATNIVNCRAVVASHDHILSLISADAGGGTSSIQNAYATILEGVAQFDTIAEAWTNGCRDALDEGIDTKIIHRAQLNELMVRFAVPEALWN